MPLREPVLWAVQIDKASFMSKVINTGTPWSQFRVLSELFLEINNHARHRHEPFLVAGPFFTKIDAERHLRSFHARMLMQAPSSNPA